MNIFVALILSFIPLIKLHNYELILELSNAENIYIDFLTEKKTYF